MTEFELADKKSRIDDWKICKLGEVAEIKMGQSPKSDSYNIKKIGLPFLQGNRTFGLKYPFFDTYCSEPKKIAKKGEVLFSVRAPVGDINWAHTDICIGRGLASFKAYEDDVFLYYLLHHMKQDIIQAETGSVFGSVSKGDLEKIEIHLPPPPEQKAIAEILSSLDDKIDLLHRQNKTLENLAETLFRHYFIDNAKDDWEKATFKKWIIETIGGDWGKEKPNLDFTKQVQCIRGTDIADLQKGLAYKTPIRYIKENKFQKIEPNKGDLIIEISGGTETQSTGRAIYINNHIKNLFDYPLVFSNFTRLIRIKNEKYSYFVYLYIKYLYEADEFFNLENGSSGIKNLNYKALLLELEFLMPTEEHVVDFNNIVKNHFEKINQNKKQIQTLEKLRDTLLPKLISGDVRVKYENKQEAN